MPCNNMSIVTVMTVVFTLLWNSSEMTRVAGKYIFAVRELCTNRVSERHFKQLKYMYSISKLT